MHEKPSRQPATRPSTRRAAITFTDLAACRRFSDALARQDLDAALAEAHPEIELCTPRGVLHGRAGVCALVAGPELEHLDRTIVVDGVVAEGARAVAHGRIELRWRGSDELADTQRVSALLDVRDGRVIRWQPRLDIPSTPQSRAVHAEPSPPGATAR